MSLNNAVLAADDAETRPNKKPRTYAFSVESCALFPDVLKVVVESYFIDTKDLGKLLLRTSKQMTQSVFPSGDEDDGNNDKVWKRLCFSRWGHQHAAPLLSTLQPMSAQDCFRKLAFRRNQVPPFEPRPLQYSPQDYVLVVSLEGCLMLFPENHTDSLLVPAYEKLLFVKSVPGEAALSFFERGVLNLDLTEALCEVKGDRKEGDRNKGELSSLCFTADVKIVRRTDNKVIQLCTMEQDAGSLHWDSTGIIKANWCGNLTSENGSSITSKYAQDLLSAFCDQDAEEYDEDNPFAKIFVLPCFDSHYKHTDNGGIGIFGFELTSYFSADGLDEIYAYNHVICNDEQEGSYLSGSESDDEDGSYLSGSESDDEMRAYNRDIQGGVTFQHFLEALDQW